MTKQTIKTEINKEIIETSLRVGIGKFNNMREIKEAIKEIVEIVQSMRNM